VSDRSLVVESQGGLGNQLFIYAFGRRVAHQWDLDLDLDVWRHTVGQTRPFVIGPALRQARIIGGPKDKPPKRLKTFSRYADSHVSKILPGRACSTSREKGLHFQRELLDAKPGLRFTGYFQSWKYFDIISEQLHLELSSFYKSVLGSGLNNNELQCDAAKSVAVLVRLTDYLDSWRVAKHGRLGVDYYQSAISYFQQLAPSTVFKIYSDDPIRALDLLRPCQGADNFQVAASSGDPLLDHAAMTKHDGMITANSTYSWWAAWISGLPGDRIVAPQNWGLNHSAHLDDLLPPDWVRL